MRILMGAVLGPMWVLVVLGWRGSEWRESGRRRCRMWEEGGIRCSWRDCASSLIRRGRAFEMADYRNPCKIHPSLLIITPFPSPLLFWLRLNVRAIVIIVIVIANRHRKSHSHMQTH